MPSYIGEMAASCSHAPHWTARPPARTVSGCTTPRSRQAWSSCVTTRGRRLAHRCRSQRRDAQLTRALVVADPEDTGATDDHMLYPFRRSAFPTWDSRNAAGLTTSTLDRKWWNSFWRLEAYKRETGHCVVPRDYPRDKKLATWVQGQRSNRASGDLLPWREEALDELGFVWDVAAFFWRSMYDELVQYHRRHGHSRVPARCPDHFRLSQWVERQRVAYRQGTLSAERTVLLASLDMVWQPHREDWDRMFAELCEYKAQHGHCFVDYSATGLGSWVHNQRDRRPLLSPDKEERLDSVGFVWSVRNPSPP